MEGFLSERRDSNSRPRPWQGRALPTELLSLISMFTKLFQALFCTQSGNRTRTTFKVTGF